MKRVKISVAVMAICLAQTGCKVAAPGRTETAVMQWVKRHVTVGGKQVKNPVPDTSENVEQGKKVFGYYCVVCYGRDGQNTGVPFAGNMSPPIPQLSSPEVQRYSDGQLKWIIENGITHQGCRHREAS